LTLVHQQGSCYEQFEHRECFEQLQLVFIFPVSESLSEPLPYKLCEVGFTINEEVKSPMLFPKAYSGNTIYFEKGSKLSEINENQFGE